MGRLPVRHQSRNGRDRRRLRNRHPARLSRRRRSDGSAVDLSKPLRQQAVVFEIPHAREKARRRASVRSRPSPIRKSAPDPASESRRGAARQASASASLSLPAIAPSGVGRARLEHDASGAVAHGDVQPRASRWIARRQLVPGEIPHPDVRDQPPARELGSFDRQFSRRLSKVGDRRANRRVHLRRRGDARPARSDTG